MFFTNNPINALHERVLRLVYNDKNSSSFELLQRDNSITIQQCNLQTLVIEIYKIKNQSTAKISDEIFT